MSKTQNLIGRAIAATVRRVSGQRHHLAIVCYLASFMLMASTAYSNDAPVEVNANHFEVVTTSYGYAGQTYHTTRITLVDTMLAGATAMQGRLRLQVNIPAIHVVAKSWSSSFEVGGVSLAPSPMDPFVVMLDYWAASSNPLTDDSKIWMEVVYAGSNGQVLYKAAAEIDGIVQIDIIEGGCKTQGVSSAAPEPQSSALTIDPKTPSLPETVDVLLYPNPAVVQVRVEYKNTEARPDRIHLIDAQGHLLAMLIPDGHGLTVDVSHLAPGQYYLIGQRAQAILWRKGFLKR